MQFEDFFYDEIRLPSVNHFMLITDGFVTEISKALFTPKCDELLNEDIRKDVLFAHSRIYSPPPKGGKARIERSKRTKVMQFSVKPADEVRYGKDYQHLEFTALADPSVEGTSHYGYVIFNNPKQSIKELFCSCNDFFFRAYYVFVKNNLATYKLDTDTKKILNTKFADRQKVLRLLGRSIDPLKKASKQANPTQEMFLCKHLYRAIREFMATTRPVPMKVTQVPKKEIPVKDINKIKGKPAPEEEDNSKAGSIEKEAPKPEVKKVGPVNREEFRKKTAEALKNKDILKQPTPAKSATKPVEPLTKRDARKAAMEKTGQEFDEQ